MKGELLFLGTGGSAGVPIIGCPCPICNSTSSYNKRLRPSALIKVQDKQFLIDVGPDFRQQALTYKIDRLDGVLLTHTHSDHVSGIDDLRVFYFLQNAKLPFLLSNETLEEIKIRYHYLLKPLRDGHSISAQLDFFVLPSDFGSIDFCGIKWRYVTYFQADMKVTGFCIGNLAYLSDIRKYDEKLFPALQGVEFLIVSALRSVPSPMHFSIDEAVEFAKKIGAKKTWLTHLSHDFDYDEASAKLPPNVFLSYDGLKIPFNYL